MKGERRSPIHFIFPLVGYDEHRRRLSLRT
jgi:hypothetical protein